MITSAIQSEWINQYGYEKKKAEDVASAWLADNTGAVAVWLDGVKTVEGQDAVQAFKAKFAK